MHRDYLCHTEFCRLLQNELHLIVLWHSLKKRERRQTRGVKFSGQNLCLRRIRRRCIKHLRDIDSAFAINQADVLPRSDAAHISEMVMFIACYRRDVSIKLRGRNVRRVHPILRYVHGRL